jgi:uncharacterized integral membrane protein
MANTTDKSGRTKLIVAGVIGVFLLLFVVQNSEKATVNFLFVDANVSVWFVIVLSAVLGFVAGWFVGRSRKA